MFKDYIEFQDRSVPLAYFISIRCYGTWLHGDDRGSMDRRQNNHFGTAKISANQKWKSYETLLLKHSAVKLDELQRPIVENAIREVCRNRGYKLYALQARTNHVHSVVAGNCKPESIMNAFKAYSTRYLRRDKLVSSQSKLWSRHGSTRYLWTERHIELAVDYVMNGQGDELPGFE